MIQEAVPEWGNVAKSQIRAGIDGDVKDGKSTSKSLKFRGSVPSLNTK